MNRRTGPPRGERRSAAPAVCDRDPDHLTGEITFTGRLVQANRSNVQKIHPSSISGSGLRWCCRIDCRS